MVGLLPTDMVADNQQFTISHFVFMVADKAFISDHPSIVGVEPQDCSSNRWYIYSEAFYLQQPN